MKGKGTWANGIKENYTDKAISSQRMETLTMGSGRTVKRAASVFTGVQSMAGLTLVNGGTPNSTGLVS